MVDDVGRKWACKLEDVLSGQLLVQVALSRLRRDVYA